MVRTGLARYCLPQAGGQPVEAVAYELQSNGFAGSIPVASRAQGNSVCFEAVGGLAKSCAPADTACLQSQPSLKYNLVYPVRTEAREVKAVDPGTAKDPEVVISVKTTFCGSEVAQTRVCSPPFSRLVKIEAQLDPRPASHESYKFEPVKGPPTPVDGPCVVVKALGSGSFVGNVTLFPGNTMKIARCETYQGGKLRLNLTYSQLQPP